MFPPRNRRKQMLSPQLAPRGGGDTDGDGGSDCESDRDGRHRRRAPSSPCGKRTSAAAASASAPSKWGGSAEVEEWSGNATGTGCGRELLVARSGSDLKGSPANDAVDSGSEVTMDSSVSSMSSKRQKTFPEQLIEMLNEEAGSGTSNSISWMPDGKSFAIIDPAALTAEVLPRYFPRCKIDSFVRKLYRWGFRKTKISFVIPDGDDDDDDVMDDNDEDNAMQRLSLRFYHKYFCRSNPRRCLKMKSIDSRGKSKKPAAQEANAAASRGGNGLCIKADDGSGEDSSQGQRVVVGRSQASAPATSNGSDGDRPLEVTMATDALLSLIPGSNLDTSPRQFKASKTSSLSAIEAPPEAMNTTIAQARSVSVPAKTHPGSQQRHQGNSDMPAAVSNPTAQLTGQIQGFPQAEQVKPVLALSQGGVPLPQGGQQSCPALITQQTETQVLHAGMQSIQVAALLRAISDELEGNQWRQTKQLIDTILCAMAEHQNRHHQPPMQAQARDELASTVRRATGDTIRKQARQHAELMQALVRTMEGRLTKTQLVHALQTAQWHLQQQQLTHAQQQPQMQVQAQLSAQQQQQQQVNASQPAPQQQQQVQLQVQQTAPQQQMPAHEAGTQQQLQQLLHAHLSTQQQHQQVQVRVEQQSNQILEVLLRQFEIGLFKAASTAATNQAVPVAPPATDAAIVAMLYPQQFQ